MDRRQFIHRAGLAGLTAVFGGCRHEDSPLGDCPNPASAAGILVPQATRQSTADSPLRIDIHSHIFNGHDVPMVDYFVRGALHAPPPLDELLKLILVPAEAVARLGAKTAEGRWPHAHGSPPPQRRPVRLDRPAFSAGPALPGKLGQARRDGQPPRRT